MNDADVLALIERHFSSRWPHASMMGKYFSSLKTENLSSLKLVSLLDELLPDVSLASVVDCPVHILDTPHFGAEVLSVRGRPCIVIHEGLLALLSFSLQTFFAAAYYANQPPRSNDIYLRDPVSTISDLSTGMVYAYLFEPFPLPVLTSQLPQDVLSLTINSLIYCEVFIILHEYGHIKLGHLIDDGNGDGVRDELDIIREQELAADEFAISCCPESVRADLLTGAGIFLWTFGRYEAVAGTHDSDHPDAAVRIRKLRERFATTKQCTKILEQFESGLRIDSERFQGAHTLKPYISTWLNNMSTERAGWTIGNCLRELLKGP